MKSVYWSLPKHRLGKKTRRQRKKMRPIGTKAFYKIIKKTFAP